MVFLQFIQIFAVFFYLLFRASFPVIQIGFQFLHIHGKRVLSIFYHLHHCRRGHLSQHTLNRCIRRLHRTHIFFRNFHAVISQDSHRAPVSIRCFHTHIFQKVIHIPKCLSDGIPQIRPRRCHQCFVAFSRLFVYTLKDSPFPMGVFYGKCFHSDACVRLGASLNSNFLGRKTIKSKFSNQSRRHAAQLPDCRQCIFKNTGAALQPVSGLAKHHFLCLLLGCLQRFYQLLQFRSIH